MIKKVGKRVVWDGPPRKAVPRGSLRDQTGGKGVGVRVMPRKPLSGEYGPRGWDKSRVPHA